MHWEYPCSVGSSMILEKFINQTLVRMVSQSFFDDFGYKAQLSLQKRARNDKLIRSIQL